MEAVAENITDVMKKQHPITPDDLKEAVLEFFRQHNLVHEPSLDVDHERYYTSHGTFEEPDAKDCGWAIRLTAAASEYGGITFHATAMMNYLNEQWDYPQSLNPVDSAYGSASSTVQWTTAKISTYVSPRREIDPHYIPAIRHTFAVQRAHLLKLRDAEKKAAELREQLGADDKGVFTGNGYKGKVYISHGGCVAGVQFDASVTDVAKMVAIRAVLDAA